MKWDNPLAEDRIPQMTSPEDAAAASAVITLEDVRAALAQHARRFGDTQQAQLAAKDVGLLFELCSLMVLRNYDLGAVHEEFLLSPPEDPLRALVARLRASPAAEDSVADGGESTFSVWDVLLLAR